MVRMAKLGLVIAVFVALFCAWNVGEAGEPLRFAVLCDSRGETSVTRCSDGVSEVLGVWHVVSGGLTRKLYPLNGAPHDTKRNTILYNGKFQNPRASVILPWDDTKESYWGWRLVTVDGDKISMDVFGSATLPKSRGDLKLLKSFVLRQ